MCISGFNFDFIIKYNNQLKFSLDWSNTGDLLLGFIPVWAEWPTINKVPVFYFDQVEAWLTYIFDIGIIYGSLHFFFCSTVLLARNIRTISVSNEYFKKDLKALKEAKIQQKGIHIKEPSEEMKEIIRKES